MNILQLLAPGPVGGLESVVRGLAAGQHARGHRVTVAASLTPGVAVPRFLDELAQLGVTVEILRAGARAYAEEVRQVKRLCAALRPDVAHTHGYRSDLVAGHAARSAGVPVVTTVHGFTTGDWRNQLNQALQRLAFRRFDAVVAVSRAIAQRVVRWGVSRERVIVIQNAYVPLSPMRQRAAARAILSVAGPEYRLGWVGRMNPDKGLDVLIEALALVPDLEWRLSVIGDGPDRAKVSARADTLGFGGRVCWHGLVPEAATLMPAFDAYVLPSRTEGTPLVLLEAMAAGVPVVATRVGGVPDVVGPDEALLVAPENPTVLAGALRELLQEPERARARAAAASRRLHDFEAGPWLDRYDGAYQAALRVGRGRGAGA